MTMNSEKEKGNGKRGNSERKEILKGKKRKEKIRQN